MGLVTTVELRNRIEIYWMGAEGCSGANEGPKQLSCVPSLHGWAVRTRLWAGALR